MPVLHLGVVDLPYQYAKTPVRMRKAREGKAARPRPDPHTESTLDVARILEAKYHIMEVFFRFHDRSIAEFMADDLMKAIKNVRAGAPMEINTRAVLQEAMSNIEDGFRSMLYLKEMDRYGIPGIPTQASLDGVSHRFANKRGYPGRPSFIDTGLFEQSFKAWMADK